METRKKNWIFIIGILLMCIGMQFANYGTAVCISGEVAKLNASQFYVLISAFGTMGMMLVLPLNGKLTNALGLRNLILLGIVIQFLGRVLMIVSATWVPFGIGNLVQSIGGGLYISAAYVNMAVAVDASERAKFFGYIAVSNAIGAIVGPILASTMYAVGGFVGSMAYFAYLPFIVIGMAMIYKNCMNVKMPSNGEAFDVSGLMLMLVSLSCLVLWLNLGGKMFTWTSAISIILMIVSIGGIFMLVKTELKKDNAIVPVKMFKNKRLTYAFIGAIVATSYSTCSGGFCIMWIRLNFAGLPLTTLFNGTSTLMQQLVIFILGLFLGGYISKKFAKRFRPFGIMAMISAMVACGILYCLKYTGTAANNDLIFIGNSQFPLGMLFIYIATAIGGFNSVIAQSTFSAFWQSNTPAEEIPAGQGMYNFANTGGSCIFSAIVGVVMGVSGDYTRAFAVGFIIACIGLICAIKGFKFTDDEINKVK